MQMNPPWQNGGLSPIRDVAIDGQAVRVNGRTLLQSLTPVAASGAAPFGKDGATEITATLAAGQLPSTQQARDDEGLASAALNYRVSLAPGPAMPSWSRSRWVLPPPIPRAHCPKRPRSI